MAEDRSGWASADAAADASLRRIREAGRCEKLHKPSRWDPAYSLKLYQQVGAAHLLVRKRFVLGDDVGLGKTVEATYAAAATMDFEEVRWIVVATRSAMLQWADEIRRFAPGIPVTVLAPGSTTKKKRQKTFQKWVDSPPNSALVIGWYHLREDFPQYMLPDLKPVLGTLWLTVDEAHRLANPESQTSVTFASFTRSLGRVQALTASLVKGEAMDACSVVDLIAPGTFSVEAFKVVHCVWKLVDVPPNRKAKELDGYKDLHKFRQVIEPVYLGRAADEVSAEVPEVRVISRRLAMSDKHQKLYRLAEANLLEMEGRSWSIEDEVRAGVLVIRSLQVANAPEYCLGETPEQALHDERLPSFAAENTKAHAVYDLLGSEASGEGIVVYCPYAMSLTYLREFLTGKGIACRTIFGEDSMDRRQAARQAFESGDCRVLLITDAGGESINLQCSRHLVMYCRPWTPGAYVQVVGRIRRIGSEHKQVLVWHLSCDDTVDDVVDSLMTEKFGDYEAIVQRKGPSQEGHVVGVDVARRLMAKRRKATRKEAGVDG
jgi:SNF2 family DNA or RNA helicase